MYPPNFDRVGVTNSSAMYAEAPKVSERVPPVGMALEQLEKELHHLREAVCQLSIKLSVVMCPKPETDNGTKHPPTPGGSPLVNQVDSLAYLTRVTSADVFAMLDCLEL